MGDNLEEEYVTVHLNLREGKLLYVGTVEEVLKLLIEIKNAKNNK